MLHEVKALTKSSTKEKAALESKLAALTEKEEERAAMHHHAPEPRHHDTGPDTPTPPTPTQTTRPGHTMARRR